MTRKWLWPDCSSALFNCYLPANQLKSYLVRALCSSAGRVKTIFALAIWALSLPSPRHDHNLPVPVQALPQGPVEDERCAHSRLRVAAVTGRLLPPRWPRRWQQQPPAGPGGRGQWAAHRPGLRRPPHALPGLPAGQVLQDPAGPLQPHARVILDWPQGGAGEGPVRLCAGVRLV